MGQLGAVSFVVCVIYCRILGQGMVMKFEDRVAGGVPESRACKQQGSGLQVIGSMSVAKMEERWA